LRPTHSANAQSWRSKEEEKEEEERRPMFFSREIFSREFSRINGESEATMIIVSNRHFFAANVSPFSVAQERLFFMWLFSGPS
jgi:hypothetical protein